MDLATADPQVDAAQDFLAPHPDVEALDHELAHCERHHHFVTFEPDRVDLNGPGGGQALRAAVLQRERAAVLGAFDGAGEGVDFAIRKGPELMTAAVGEGVHLGAQAGDANPVGAALGPDGRPVRHVRQVHPDLAAHDDGLRPKPTDPSLAATAWRRPGRMPRAGNRTSTSSRNPRAINSSAAAVGTPRLSR